MAVTVRSFSSVRAARHTGPLKLAWSGVASHTGNDSGYSRRDRVTQSSGSWKAGSPTRTGAGWGGGRDRTRRQSFLLEVMSEVPSTLPPDAVPAPNGLEAGGRGVLFPQQRFSQRSNKM